MIVRIHNKDQARVSRTIAALALLAIGVFAYLELSSEGWLAGNNLIKRFEVGDGVKVKVGEFAGRSGVVEAVDRSEKPPKVKVKVVGVDDAKEFAATEVSLDPKKVLGVLQTWGQVIGLVSLAGSAVAAWILLNRPGIVTFMAAMETELRKVSWPTKDQVVGSSVVVIITMLVLAAYLFIVDTLLTLGVRTLLGGG